MQLTSLNLLIIIYITLQRRNALNAKTQKRKNAKTQKRYHYAVTNFTFSGVLLLVFAAVAASRTTCSNS